jgi:tetratricopeptide (TPR) repeat protein
MAVNLTIALEYHQRGDLERAGFLYQEALAQDPENADALNLLGVVRIQQGDPAQAVRLIAQAVALRPNDPSSHVNLGEAYRALGDLDRTIDCCRTALRLDPASAHVHGNLALALISQGKQNLAVDHFRAAIRLMPGKAGLHHDLGNALQELGRLEEARDAFLEARRLDPDRGATHASLAQVWEQLGEFEKAIESLRETLRREPRHPWALGRLATRLRGKLPEADRAAIEGVLADPRLPRESRAELLFGLVQAHDDRGEFDRAARLSIEANSIQRHDFQKSGLAYDHEAHHRFVDRLIADFSAPFFDRVRGFGMETDRPVFIVGLPRSGTSLTEQILASHPQVFGAGELTLTRRIFEALPGAADHGGMPFTALPTLDRETVLGLAHRYLHELAALNDSADRVVDKMPDNTVYLGLIVTVFPRAKLIYCRRDVRDVALSCWMTNFMQVRWACDPEQITRRIGEHERLMEHWRQVLPVPMLEVDYEELVADLEKGARAIVARCGLDWDPACLEFHKNKRAVRTSSVEQVRQPIYTSSVGRWKNYEQSLAPLFTNLAGSSCASGEPHPAADAVGGKGVEFSED